MVDGEERRVYNKVSLTRRVSVWGHGQEEELSPVVGGPDGPSQRVECVSERVANVLYRSHGVEVEDLDLDVVNLDSEEVQLL